MDYAPASFSDRGWTLDSPPLQGGGRGWGLSAGELATLKQRARDMRNNPAEPEKRLWRHLANAQLQGLKFRRQEVIGRTVVDFWCPSAALAMEVDGDTHADAKHDRRRDEYLNKRGIHVLHVTNAEVMTNMEGVLAVIAAAAAGDSPHPNPSPEGEGLS